MSDPVDLAKTYVALSNAHDLDAIFATFSPDIDYRTSQYGTFLGAAAVEEMMRGFFEHFPDAHWDADEWDRIDDVTARFSFRMTGTNAETGERVDRAGVETIGFDAQGRIDRVRVGVHR